VAHRIRAPDATRRNDPMHIGIIGAGQIGGTLARKLTALGHTVSLANSRGPETLTALAAETGATAVSVAAAVKDVELVVVTIPQKSVPLLPKGLFQGVPDDVVVVDTGNYYPSFRDGRIEDIEGGMTESRWVARQLGRSVVKAFNSIMWFSLAHGSLPPGTPGRIALPIAGDDTRAKTVVLGLVDALGFDGIDAGTLDESWRQEPGTPVYCTDFDAQGVRRALSQADRTRSHDMRELSIRKMQQLPKGTSPQDLIRLVRSLH
jgi:predicted dinucleotide-binding enzyme